MMTGERMFDHKGWKDKKDHHAFFTTGRKHIKPEQQIIGNGMETVLFCVDIPPPRTQILHEIPPPAGLPVHEQYAGI